MSAARPAAGAQMASAPIAPARATARGVSGAVRRLAYAVPEHKARHWLLLMAADRLDVLEHRVQARPGPVLAGLAVVVAALVVAEALRRR